MADFESRENPVFGRKVFFINPSFSIEQIAKNRLRNMEYETYIISDYRYAKGILKKNPDSICLINLDHVGDKSLTVVQWLNFLISCEKDPELESIFFGVLSVNTSPRQMNMFFYNTKLPAGYIPASPNKDDLAETLACVLDVNGAKGRRQYVRATCEARGTAFINLRIRGEEYKFPIVDFSSVGLACQIPDGCCGMISENTLLQNVELFLLGEKFITSLIVLKEFKRGDKNTLITLLSKGVSTEVKNKIRSYVFRILESIIDSNTEFNNPDTTEYSLKFEKVDKKDMVVNVEDLSAKGPELPAELESI